MLYRGFPATLHHEVPPCVEPGALFHIRVAIDCEKEQQPLTEPTLAQGLLDSARFYEFRQRWYITLFLLMPDHLHALLSFARDQSMSSVIGDWKHFQAHKHAIEWQAGYFDHRLRNDEWRAALSQGKLHSPKSRYGRFMFKRCRLAMGDRTRVRGSSRSALDAKPPGEAALISRLAMRAAHPN